MHTKHVAVAHKSFAVLALFGILFGSFGLSFGGSVPVARAATQECSVLMLGSGASTMTAGYTATNPVTDAAGVLPSNYSFGQMLTASSTQMGGSSWITPANDPVFATTSAVWVSSDPLWPGAGGNTESTSQSDQWRLFTDSFTLPVGAVVTDATVWYAADNATAVYLNDTVAPIATTNATSSEEVYGAATSNAANYHQSLSAAFSPVAGVNTLKFVLRNWNTTATENPTGLLYSAVVHYCVPATTPPSTVMVSIDAYVDGMPATAASAASSTFPMNATWSATNIGAGTGAYTLDTTNAYQAATIAMSSGANYATSEDTTGPAVGAVCATGTPYALVGYVSGDTLAEALAATPTTTAPSFTGLMTNKVVLVLNHNCAVPAGTIGGTVTGGGNGQGALAVTSVTATQTSATADGSFANGWKYVFHITVPNNESHLAMKFGNWFNSLASSTLLVGGNMQISSAQSSNPGPISISAANTYSTPVLNMVTDLDPAMAGRQVDVEVDVKIPVGSTNGAYTTTYGVQTQ